MIFENKRKKFNFCCDAKYFVMSKHQMPMSRQIPKKECKA